jgi:hypothetical protein
MRIMFFMGLNRTVHTRYEQYQFTWTIFARYEQYIPVNKHSNPLPTVTDCMNSPFEPVNNSNKSH